MNHGTQIYLLAFGATVAGLILDVCLQWVLMRWAAKTNERLNRRDIRKGSAILIFACFVALLVHIMLVNNPDPETKRPQTASKSTETSDSSPSSLAAKEIKQPPDPGEPTGLGYIFLSAAAVTVYMIFSAWQRNLDIDYDQQLITSAKQKLISSDGKEFARALAASHGLCPAINDHLERYLKIRSPELLEIKGLQWLEQDQQRINELTMTVAALEVNSPARNPIKIVFAKGYYDAVSERKTELCQFDLKEGDLIAMCPLNDFHAELSFRNCFWSYALAILIWGIFSYIPISVK